MDNAQTPKVTIRDKARNTVVKITDYATNHPIAWQVICGAIGVVVAIIAAVLAKYCGTIGTVIGGVIRLAAPEMLGIF